MRDPFNWSLNLGRWWGLAVRVHVSFLVFAAATLYLCWPTFGVNAAGHMFPIVVCGFGLLFLSVLWHELAHYLVARWDHFEPDEIVLGPLGGLTNWRSSRRASVEWRFAIAGPLANLFAMIVGIATLWISNGPLDLIALINPLSPAWVEVGSSELVQGLQIGIWINGLLLLVNLLPAFPFDGGRIFLASILFVRPNIARRTAAELVFWVTIVTASIILLTSLVLWKHATDTLFPTWFSLVLLAVILLVSARRDALHDTAQCGQSAAPPAKKDPEKNAHGPQFRSPAISRRARSSASDHFDRETQAHSAEPESSDTDEEHHLDDVLHRLHVGGMESLDTRDRDLLRRVSARFRARRDRARRDNRQ